jgi:hypothetical protein
MVFWSWEKDHAGRLASQSYVIKRGDGAMSVPIERGHFQSQRKAGSGDKKRKKSAPFMKLQDSGIKRKSCLWREVSSVLSGCE